MPVPVIARACALTVVLSTSTAGAAPPDSAPQDAAPVAEASPAPEPEPNASWVEPGHELAPEAPPPPSSGVDPKNYRMALSGNILIGLGVGGFMLMATGFLIASSGKDGVAFAQVQKPPDEAEVAKFQRRREVGFALGYAGAISAAALISAGITLTSLGRSRERKRREALSTSGLRPAFGPGVAGLSWAGRF